VVVHAVAFAVEQMRVRPVIADLSIVGLDNHIIQQLVRCAF
jgi:DNA-binding LacI/PurR family transcriptional regulator